MHHGVTIERAVRGCVDAYVLLTKMTTGRKNLIRQKESVSKRRVSLGSPTLISVATYFISCLTWEEAMLRIGTDGDLVRDDGAIDRDSKRRVRDSLDG